MSKPAQRALLRARSVVLVLALLLAVGAPRATEAPDTGGGSGDRSTLGELTIEELMDVEFTSASKRTEKLSEAKAAAFVITAEDLRRSGVRTIPEALRMVPGIHVGRVGSNRWAISSRGFNGVFANKLLVLMDGRSVYDPLYSGVFWDVQDTVIEDIERIEVIRGPGAALWGANAVNGVINIITKDSTDTRGTLVDVAGGDETPADVTVRYGGGNDRLAYRTFVRYHDRDEVADALGNGLGDDWNLLRAGLRADWRPGDRDHVLWTAEVHDGRFDELVRIPIFEPPYLSLNRVEESVSGGHLMGRWARRFTDDSSLELQASYARTERALFDTPFEQDILDLDFQHALAHGERHALLWGFCMRTVRDDFGSGPVITVEPASDTFDLFSAFAQDDIRLSNRTELTVGAKLEHNDFSGWEFQPNVRGLWSPGSRHSVWFAIANAVRTPSRAETGAIVNLFPVPPTPDNPVPGVLRVIPADDLPAEELVAYEIGYRVLAAETLSLDLAAFYNDYDELLLNSRGLPFAEPLPPPAHLVYPITWRPVGEGHTFGVEVESGWQPLESWRIQLAAGTLQIEIDSDDPTAANSLQDLNDGSPSWQASVRSLWNVTDRVEFDVWVRHVAKLPSDAIDAYTELDARLGWRPSERWELMLGGRNLLNERHAEFLQEDFQGGEIERRFYGRAIFRF